MDGYTDIQQGDFIVFLLFFQYKESRFSAVTSVASPFLCSANTETFPETGFS
jgi:hypothetical protein